MIKYESFAGIAQSVEQLIRNQQVVCSSHITSSSPRIVVLQRFWGIFFVCFSGHFATLQQKNIEQNIELASFLCIKAT